MQIITDLLLFTHIFRNNYCQFDFNFDIILEFTLNEKFFTQHQAREIAKL
jgi:hypothetical protein